MCGDRRSCRTKARHPAAGRVRIESVLMPQRRFLGDVSDLRTVLDRTGDVEIGAWVPRRRRRRLAVAGSGLLLIGMAVLVYVTLRTDRGIGPKDGFPAEFKCITLTCGEEFSRRIGFGQETPLNCPKCGERSAKPVWKCVAGHRFVPEGALHPESISCPECGSRRVGSAAATSQSAEIADKP